MTTARDHALSELDRRDLPHWPPNQLRATSNPPPSDPRDLALAEILTLGTIQNLLLLQHLISYYSNRPIKKIDPLVQKILALALYQLRFLTRIPASAAVNEAVNQTKRLGRSSAANFTNAILRNALRQPNPPLPSEQSDPEAYAELVLSHPREVYRQLLALTHNDPAAALSLCRHNNQTPPTILRLFEGITPADLLPLLNPQSAIPNPQSPTLLPHTEGRNLYVIEGAKQPLLADLAARGLAQVQDPTAAKVASHCDLRPGQSVLDRCAGLGTKTLQLLQAITPTGSILAVDPSPERTTALQKILQKRGISNVKIERKAWLSTPNTPLPAKFERVLADVPCSNSGVLPRRPEARYHQTRPTLQSLQDLQLKILTDTAPLLTPHGLLIYSTCSIWPHENQGTIATFLASHPHFTLLEQHATLPTPADTPPTSYHDGGYIAVLRRN